MSKFSLKIAFILSIIIFTTMSFTIILMGLAAVFLIQHGIIDKNNWKFGIIILGFVSILVGTLVSRIISRNQIKTVVDISNATKEVIKGNFDITLDENIRATEIRTMIQNFNVMIKELGNTELFRNDFIENVSHEFKTPLSAIEGYATLLQKKDISEKKRLNTRIKYCLIQNVYLHWLEISCCYHGLKIKRMRSREKNTPLMNRSEK